MSEGKHSGTSRSIWMRDPRLSTRGPLTQDERVDVCIVGAGISGLTTAFLLAGKMRVLVLDDGPIAQGESERTSAHLSNVLDTRYVDLERLHGQESTKLIAESHQRAISFIESVAQRKQIACDFERLDGYLFAPPGGDARELDRELAAVHIAGMKDVVLEPRAPIDGFETGPALRFPNQAQFHPLRYLEGLVVAIEQAGGRIHSGTHVTRIDGGHTPRVYTRHGKVITAKSVVVATNVPIHRKLESVSSESAHRSYVIAAPIPRGALTRALYWDTCASADGPCEPGGPYHYVRLAEPPAVDGAMGKSVNELLVVGGEDHPAGSVDDADERYERLAQWARDRFPSVGPVQYRWSGQIMQSADALAYIGRDPTGQENIYIATGDSGSGMTHGTIAGLLIRDLIIGERNPWEQLYDPLRVRLHALGQSIKNSARAVAKLAAWVTPGEIGAKEEVPLGEGRIVRRGLAKIAVYRSKEGELVELSAVCPHLGCLVGWNGAEKTWDCPCHGSRFDARGRVVNGPANKDLPRLPVHPAE